MKTASTQKFLETRIDAIQRGNRPSGQLRTPTIRRKNRLMRKMSNARRAMALKKAEAERVNHRDQMYDYTSTAQGRTSRKSVFKTVVDKAKQFLSRRVW